MSGEKNNLIKVTQTLIHPGDNNSDDSFSIEMEYVYMNGGELYPATGGSIYGSISVKDSRLSNINNSYTGIFYIWYPISECRFERNVFDNCGPLSIGTNGVKVTIKNNVFLNKPKNGYYDCHILNWASYGDEFLTEVKYNSFLDTTSVAVKLPKGYSDAYLHADSNYWNTIDDATIQSMIFDYNDDYSSNDSISYKPFLHNPHQDTPVIMDFDVDTLVGLSGETAFEFTDLSEGNVTEWMWDFGDGSTSTAQHPSHVYTTSGTYDVKLIVSNDVQSDSIVKESLIYVEAPFVVDFDVDTLVGLSGETAFEFTDLSEGNVTEWMWDFGDGSTSTAQHPSHVYTTSGTYDVKLIVSNDVQSDSIVKESLIYVEAPFVVDFDVDTLVGLSGETAFEFTDLSEGNVMGWMWDFGDGSTSTDQHPSHVYTTSGTYDVKLIVSNDVQSAIKSKDDWIIVEDETVLNVEDQLPEATISIAPNPVKEEINVLLEDHTIYESYKLISFSGKIIRSGSVLSNNISISAQDLSSGIYFLKLITKAQHITVRKIIKK
ncbi:T9SS type A sorting domain-containing protein [Algivirga pacifica]